MTLKEFIKSKWFPVLIFVLLEIIFIWVSYNITPTYGFPCKIGEECGYDNISYNPLSIVNIFGTFINLAISFIIYYLIKKYYK